MSPPESPSFLDRRGPTSAPHGGPHKKSREGLTPAPVPRGPRGPPPPSGIKKSGRADPTPTPRSQELATTRLAFHGLEPRPPKATCPCHVGAARPTPSLTLLSRPPPNKTNFNPRPLPTPTRRTSPPPIPMPGAPLPTPAPPARQGHISSATHSLTSATRPMKGGPARTFFFRGGVQSDPHACCSRAPEPEPPTSTPSISSPRLLPTSCSSTPPGSSREGECEQRGYKAAPGGGHS